MASAQPFEWCRETYERSISSTCWWYTGYAGWEESQAYGPDLRADAELRRIVQMEFELHPLPEWAVQIVRSDINGVPPCGHYSFPAAYLRVLEAIGAQRSNGFNYTCYTADRARKGEAIDYCLCLDAWLAEAAPDAVAAELEAMGSLRLDWRHTCTQLWSALGDRAEAKELLVERILLQLRGWVKLHVWSDDRAARFGRDQFLGALVAGQSPAVPNGNWGMAAPTFDLGASPRIRKIEARLAQLVPDWSWFREKITSVDYGCHPCAPKAFRFLERLLWAVGKLQPLAKDAGVPDFLSASVTYPNQDEASAWWSRFLPVLQQWWRGQAAEGQLAMEVAARLGQHTPLKSWLVRLYARRLQLHEECGELRRLVHPSDRAMRGRRPLGAHVPPLPASGE